METRLREGVVKEEKFPNARKPSHWQVCGEFRNIRGQHNWEEKKKKKKPTDTGLTATPIGEVFQMLTSTCSNQGLNRKTRTVCLG